MTASERFWAKVVKTDGCWQWTGALSAGYGTFSIGDTTVRAHRFSYELAVGPIPDKLHLDHICHNQAAARGECAGGSACPHRRCANPAHLEPVTIGENVLRGATLAAANSMKTHCPQGHPYDDTNTHITATGSRICRACQRDYQRVRRITQRKEAS